MSIKKKSLSSATESPILSDVSEADHRLDVTVIFTSVNATIAALKRAAALTSSLSPRIVLVAPQLVPYPLSLEKPPVPLTFIEQQVREIAAESPVETTSRLYLCRDPWQTLTTILKPRSLVVIGVQRRWWPTREKRLARKLRLAGYEVILTETA